ncbi:MAG: amidohydrolase [Bacteroidetes bacterium]|nr:amidohydrolase [Bacteroidota bacterium]
MEHIRKKIKELSGQFFLEMVEVRRKIHSNPELSFQEYETSALISDFLRTHGIDCITGIAKTGVVGIISGKNPGKRIVALRADMDALPVTEMNEVEYKSKNEGKMHLCGHDVHIASLLGTAKILQTLKNEFEGTVKLIFQPSEERYPGGAKVMIDEGVLDLPKPDAIFGQHVYQDLNAGIIGMKSGMYMASTDEIFITVRGKGGHAATPHKNIDPVLIAAHLIVALQQIASRNANPAMPTVLSFGKVIADGQTNVIPDEVKLAGIMRTFDEGWRSEMKTKITSLAKTLALSMGGSSDVFIDEGYPVLVNNQELTLNAMKYASEYLGEDNVKELEMRTTSEDFAYFAQKIPGCFYRLGIRNEAKGFTSNLHSATFDVDESSIETGMGLMAWMAVRELENG